MSTNKTVENESAGGSAAAGEFYQMFIDGEWVGARGGGTLAIIDPATEELVAHVANGGADEAQAAVEAARRAFDEGPWPRMTAPERAALLRAAAPRYANAPRSSPVSRPCRWASSWRTRSTT